MWGGLKLPPKRKTFTIGAMPLRGDLAVEHREASRSRGDEGVGLEALAFGLPLGVLAIPGHGHVFEYVERGVAIPLDVETLAAGVEQLMTARPDASIREQFIERHMAYRGEAARRIATRIIELERGES